MRILNRSIDGMTLPIFCYRFDLYIANCLMRIFSGEESSILAGAVIEKVKDEPTHVEFVFMTTQDGAPKVLGGLMAHTPNRPDIVKVFVRGQRPKGWFDDLKEWVDDIAQATAQTDQHHKEKPGPKPMSSDEKKRLVLDFRKTGLTQEKYCQLNGKSKHALQTSLKWYREKYESA